MAHRLSRYILTLAVWAACATFSFGQSNGSTVGDLIDQVSLDSLTSYVEILSGMTPVMVSDSVLLYQQNDSTLEIYSIWLEDTLVTLTNRWYLSNDVATYYLEEKLRSFGLDTVVTIPGNTDPWLRNVIAIKRGTVNPERQYIICAHYDGVRVAPAADDNGSGSAAVLEAARIFAGVDPTSTIVFAFWDSEEIGLFGSAEYAAAARDSAVDIAAVINLDMIGWDGDDDHLMEIHSDQPSSFIVDDVKRAINDFGLDLTPEVFNPGTGRSDHASFWKNGYPAVLLIEDFNGGDFNPRYHTAGDSLQYFNTGFFFEMAKLGLATIATYVVRPPAVSNETTLPSEAGPAGLRLEQNHPNPFTSSTQISFTLDRSEQVSIRVWDILGREIDTMPLGLRQVGRHSVTWTPTDQVPNGVFVYSLESAAGVQSRMMVLAR